jgi:hypothetical protein
MFFSLSKSATSTWLTVSEWGLLMFGFVLVVGLVGESKRFQKRSWFKARHNLFETLVIVRVAGELLADGGIFMFSGHLQTITDSEIASLQTTNATLVKVAGEANKQAELAKERTEQLVSSNLLLRADLAKLEAAVEWRTITPTQEAKLIEFFKRVIRDNLLPDKTVEVSAHQPTDLEAMRYARRITKVLGLCGFDAKMGPPHFFFDDAKLSELTTAGVLVFQNGKAGDKLFPAVNALVDAFKQADIIVQPTVFTNQPADGIARIRVLAKPEK